MNQLNQWLRNSRTNKALDLRQLAQLSGISFGQIGRIENGTSCITLSALVRLVYGLDKNLDDVYFELGVVNPTKTENASIIPGDIFQFFSIADIEAIIKLFHNDKKRTKRLLINGYSMVLDAITPYKQSDSIRINPEELINNVLEKNQSHLITYPQDITSSQIETICFNDGVITLHDFGAYIKANRDYYGVSLRKLGEQSNFSYNTIFRLEQTGNTKILFNDIIAMDNSLKLCGKLIAISWAAGEYLTGIIRNRFINKSQSGTRNAPISWTKEEQTIIESFIIVSRWIMILFPDKPYWFYEVVDNSRNYS